jgi:hypothetical protein
LLLKSPLGEIPRGLFYEDTFYVGNFANTKTHPLAGETKGWKSNKFIQP